MIKIEKEKKGIKNKLSIAVGALMFLIIFMVPIGYVIYTIYLITQTELAAVFYIIFAVLILISVPILITKNKASKQRGLEYIYHLIDSIEAQNVSLSGDVLFKIDRYTWTGTWEKKFLEIDYVLTSKYNTNSIEIQIPFEKFINTPFWLVADNDFIKAPKDKPDIIKEINDFSLNKIKDFPRIHELQIITESPYNLFLCSKKRNTGYKYLFPKYNEEDEIIFRKLEEPMESLFLQFSLENKEPVKFTDDNIKIIIEYVSLLMDLRNYLMTLDEIY